MNKYDEIMDKIVVTPEMQERILKNISKTDLKQKNKIIPFQKARKYLSIAVCLTVLIVGAASAALWNQNGVGQNEEKEPGVEASYGGVVEQESREALEQAVGFTVQELADIPFDVTEITYTSLWDEIAEITYSDGTQTITYRKALLTEEESSGDISGDYSEYEHEKQLTVGGMQITAKGNGEYENLAIWQDGTYAYSIMIPAGVAEDVLTNMIQTLFE